MIDDPVARLFADLQKHYGWYCTLTFRDSRERPGFAVIKVMSAFDLALKINSPPDHWIAYERGREIQIPRAPTEPEYQI